MSKRWAGQPTASLFGQLLAMITLSLVAAQAISLVLLFNLPPPAPDFYRLTEIAQALSGRPPTFTERSPLVIRAVATPPPMVSDGRMTAVIRKQLAQIRAAGSEHVLILAGDHLYRMDYAAMMAFHGETGADITVAVQPVPKDEASRFGILKRGGDGRILDFVEKPTDPEILAELNAFAASMELMGFDFPAEPN